MANKNHVVLLGLGMQGQASLFDLSRCEDVSRITVVDSRPDLNRRLESYSNERVFGRALDVDDEGALRSVMNEADVVVEALPAPYTLKVAALAAQERVHCVSSMYLLNPGKRPQEIIEREKEVIRTLDNHARQNGVTILPEFGLDPGIDLVMGAQAVRELDEVHEFYSYGAGLPVGTARANPLNYKFSWTPYGVMLSYLRPATLVRGGEEKNVAADRIFEPGNTHLLELSSFDQPLECFPNGDGVHYARQLGILDTVQETGRFACRYPGHCRFWEAAAKGGFLSTAPMSFGNTSITPARFSSELLGGQEQFQYREDERDLTLLRVDARGLKNGEKVRLVYQMIDYRDMETGFTSMQRTVGLTMSLGARMIMDGRIDSPGLLQPSELPYSVVAEGLKEYGMSISKEQMAWN